MEFRQQLSAYAQQVETALNQAVPLNHGPEKRLLEAMRYSLLGGGKRLRAALLLAFYEACGGREETALPFACAVEMVHAYSLIHDDLPCMDDDDLRRGKPSCHVAFGEATALLAGDALLTLAFDTMLHADAVPAECLVQAAGCLSRAIGAQGMIGGQIMDLANEEAAHIQEERLCATDAWKTGALITAACEIGCRLAQADESRLSAARAYAGKIGLAFQITDDILDVSASQEVLGKPVGSDKEQGKATYVSLYGVETAKQKSAQLLEEAKNCLKQGGFESSFLSDLADYILERRS